MKTKQRVERPKVKPNPRLPDERSRQEHYGLREILADCQPMTYGEVRRNFGIQPGRLEYHGQIYGEVFVLGTELGTGKPTIALRPGNLPPFEDLAVRNQLVRIIKKSSLTGVLLKTLHRNTNIDSREIARLLKDVPEVTASRKGKSEVLYKSRIQDSLAPADQVPEPLGEALLAPETPSKIEPSDGDVDDPLPYDPGELLAGRNMLLALVEKTGHRHLSWLENYMDRALIKRVIQTYPNDFQAESADLGGGADLLVRRTGTPSSAIPALERPKAVAGPVTESQLLAQEQVDRQRAEEREKIHKQEQVSARIAQEHGAATLEQAGLSDEEIQAMKFRPPSPGMHSRRGAQPLRGGLYRVRKPLVELS
jgi:hypothetical protein